MEKKKLIYIIVAVIVVISLALGVYLILNENKSDFKEYNEFKIYDTKGEYKDYDNTLFVDGYTGSYDKAYYIEGELTSEKAYEFAIITFNLYDKKGNLLGIAQAGINDIIKDTKVSFKALSLTTTKQAEQVKRYEIKEITGN
jgi:hypothetical protein